uniref:Squalene cyclase N-terminal domain-containing protein n=1 Tax=Nelumbo nucifera TaxID=4432 RepID=A0A822ZRU0_NELNU|nr:TPA_asm: hypothetical protein HUJ06_004491 [Nelumbo nucifera]
MWKLKIAQGGGPYIYSTNNYIGRQIWEFDPNYGTPEEIAQVEQARQEFWNNRFKVKPGGDVLLRLQVIGLYEWEGNNPMAPEFWLIPSFFPLSPENLWCHTRLMYLPMSYLYAKRFVGPITPLVLQLREEIHSEPYHKIRWSKTRHMCAKEDLHYPHPFIQDLLWDTLYILTEPLLMRWPFNKLRERALKQTMKHIHYEDQNSRYITIACVLKVI